MSYKRRIGYYELFNLEERLCDKVYPEDLEVAPLTHINLAFVLFDSTFNMIDNAGGLISRVSFLKSRYRGLRVNIAIGGWTFNDPPTQTLFSDMASSYSNRQTFISSLVSFLRKYGLDGVDMDWEYPAATDRGGIPADTDNYVLLMSEIREAFDRTYPGWEATITVPTSYWYLRGFDVTRLQKYVSWFNVMSYDLHGMWDQHNRFTGPYLEGHTNITDIDQGLDLLWRNGIDPANVVMGFAFYGRSFTMSDASCSKPGCTFSTSGLPGTCTHTGGILSYSELSSRNHSLNTQTYYDPTSSVKYNVYDGNQWISYDDEQSFFDKKRFLSSRCLSGLMIWAIDQDTQNHDALEGLLGDFSASQLEGGNLDNKTATALSSVFGAYTGQSCFVTPTCTDGSDGEKQNEQVCPSGTMSVATAHSPLQAPGHDLHGVCSDGWYRHICCPTNAMPKNCAWNGAPIRSQSSCSGKCGSNQFVLNTDTFINTKGEGSCYTGTRNLCCDSTQIIDECFWTACQGPLGPTTAPSCTGDSDYQTYRFDQDNGDWCSSTYVSSVDGAIGSPFHDRFKRAFCCPKGKGFRSCNWSNNPRTQDQPGGIVVSDPSLFCKPQACASTQTQVTQALKPPQSPEINPTHTGGSCDGFIMPAGYNSDFPYCCDPPSTYSDKWPVDPKYLFEHYYDTHADDVMWSYDDEYRNNNADTHQAPPGDETGEDAYGFIMLDGPPGSLDNNFPATHTIARRTAAMPKTKRSILTTNSTIMDSTFEHGEETIYVYCNHAEDSPECQHVWFKGAEDTIIKLPNHVGEGPYARIVSMELAEREYELSRHHILSRSVEGNTNPVYKLRFDYDFHLIKRDEVVNMRVDYTNLLGYWDELTNTPASKHKKREAYQEHLSKDEWHSKIGEAKRKHDRLRKRKEANGRETTTTDMSPGDNNLSKRWFGTFLAWLGRLNTVESKEVGFLSMAIQKTLLLLKAATGCPGQTFSANMNMYLDANVEMEATYAYYFSGTIVPPAVTGTYAFFSLEPSAYLGLRLVGNARLQASTGRKKLLDTVSYPGLSIKGIAAVGPTLDLYGEIRGVISLKGEMKAGAKLNFGKAEVYWPQDDDASAKFQQLLGTTADPVAQSEDLIKPTFDAKVRVDAQIDVLVTPEANMGLRVGGKITGGTPLVDAQLVGYVNTSLSFQASATASGGSTSDTSLIYRYGVYLYYNLGYAAYATVKFFPNWALSPRNAYNPTPRFTIYEGTGSFTGTGANVKRGIAAPETAQAIRFPRRVLLGSLHSAEISPIDHLSHELGDDIRSLSQNDSSSIHIDTILGKRVTASDDSFADSQVSDFTSQLTCPAGDTAQIRLPDFRYNCGIFGNSQLNSQGTFASVPGICSGIQTFFTKQSLANSEIVLTLDPNGDRADERRAAACGQQYCFDDQDNLRNSLGIANLQISCDEFPFAGSEEGGAYMGSNPIIAQRTCVPAWQNTLQGNCNKILSQLQTNVAYFERQSRGDNVENFVGWKEDSWTQDGGAFNGQQIPPQRLARYPNQVPHAAGVSDNEYTSSGRTIGYMYKRNFTMGLASPNDHNDGAAWVPGTGPAKSWTLRDGTFPVGTDGGDLTAIACAVNTFGQHDIFLAPYNALCFSGKYLKSGRGMCHGVSLCLLRRTWLTTAFLGFDVPASFKACEVEFGTGGTTKRSIGEFNGWDVKSIKISGNPVVSLPEDYVPPGPLFPVASHSTPEPER